MECRAQRERDRECDAYLAQCRHRQSASPEACGAFVADPAVSVLTPLIAVLRAEADTLEEEGLGYPALAETLRLVARAKRNAADRLEVEESAREAKFKSGGGSSS
jgi:hypothetical protein